MCGNDPECGVKFASEYRSIWEFVRNLEVSKTKVMASMSDSAAYRALNASCADIGGGSNSRRLTSVTAASCMDTTHPYNHSLRIEMSKVASLTASNEITVTFGLNLTSDAYRVLVGVTHQDIHGSPFNGSNFSSWEEEFDECIQPLNQASTPSANASAVLNETCFYKNQDSHQTNASMYVIVLRCASDVVVSRHVAAVTVNHFLRGTSEFVTFHVEGFDLDIDDFEVGVQKKIGDLLAGALDPIDSTIMSYDLTIEDYPPFDDARYRVAVGLDSDDCSMLTYERSNYDSTATTAAKDGAGVYIRVDPDPGNWTAYCNGTWPALPTWEPFESPAWAYLSSRPYCYCVIVEESPDTWIFDVEYSIRGSIADGYENLTWTPSRRLATTTSLVGETTTGRFTVRRASSIHDDHDEHHGLLWMGMVTLVSNTALAVLMVIICVVVVWLRRGEPPKEKDVAIAAAINDEPWHERLRVPRFMPTTVVRRSVRSSI